MAADLEVLGQMIKRAQYRNHRTMDAALKDVGVSLVQWDALRAIDRMPGASGHELAVATFQSDQAFGTLATRLVERGLITRSAGRGRSLEHGLSDAGRTALQDGHSVASSVLDDLFAPLDSDHRSELLRALRLLTQGE
ncbi:MarR family winged helix-turn-helix transcriptional regulator [Curtobacterium sp. VKM Ac-2887]|uniref:MarR family winged helix-turn-helix transcriptional regulator n=1 Tax=Curtobacterium sp. VKM Ac-2887 TaxID=2783819 RepID=UPI00188D6447|nr:MarR family transcriptional regulator [Curtobacterium sp. VKM Ac-2887]MBF4588306.1 MarR family transcriptional regulator [Curtobacterium sp. VKM Ac-2887]